MQGQAGSSALGRFEREIFAELSENREISRSLSFSLFRGRIEFDKRKEDVDAQLRTLDFVRRENNLNSEYECATRERVRGEFGRFAF